MERIPDTITTTQLVLAGAKSMTNHFNEVSKLFEQLGRRHELANVFNDFLTLAICGYHQTNIKTRLQVKDEHNEELYLRTLQGYGKEEINIFPKILVELMKQVYDDPYSDILGQYYTENITRGQNGQYFTPDALCDMMAAMQGENESIDDKTISDPSCGSGRMLLRFAKQNPNNYFFGTDNSNTCAKMATLNFFLNGLRGEVAWMNTLSMEWYGGWHINTDSLGIIPIEKDQSLIWTKPPEPKKILLPSELSVGDVENSGKAPQLELF